MKIEEDSDKKGQSQYIPNDRSRSLSIHRTDSRSSGRPKTLSGVMFTVKGTPVRRDRRSECLHSGSDMFTSPSGVGMSYLIAYLIAEDADGPLPTLRH